VYLKSLVSNNIKEKEKKQVNNNIPNFFKKSEDDYEKEIYSLKSK
jgi:hypothetical protein